MVYSKKLDIIKKIQMTVVALGVFVSSLTIYVNEAKAMSAQELVNMPLSQSLPVINPLKAKLQNLAMMQGWEISPDDPLNIKFYFKGRKSQTVSSKDMQRMIKYFLGFLALPQDKLWVNLSAYEKDRMIPQALAQLDIGKDFLLEDYLLKQLTSSLTSPSSDCGKNFWQEVEKTANKTAISSFYKVWIVPDTAQVNEYVSGPQASKNQPVTMFVSQARLKVLMEEDYLATQKNSLSQESQDRNKEVIKIFKREVLPIIEQQVNKSASFAPLRQMYNCLILAICF